METIENTVQSFTTLLNKKTLSNVGLKQTAIGTVIKGGGGVDQDFNKNIPYIRFILILITFKKKFPFAVLKTI